MVNVKTVKDGVCKLQGKWEAQGYNTGGLDRLHEQYKTCVNCRSRNRSVRRTALSVVALLLSLMSVSIMTSTSISIIIVSIVTVVIMLICIIIEGGDTGVCKKKHSSGMDIHYRGVQWIGGAVDWGSII